MNSQGTCLKLFNFQGEAEASPLIDADKPALELADSISWLVLLSKDNITTADSALSPTCPERTVLLPWTESCLALNCGRLWNVWLEKRPGRVFEDIFRTSILFRCFPHVWGSGESWQNGAYKDLRLLAVSTDMSKQAPVVAAILFVCLQGVAAII